MISVETQGRVAVVQVAHGKANALDTTLCRELAAQLAGLERSGHRAAGLTGQGPIFSAGVDLLRLRDGGAGYLQEFLPALSEAFLAVFNCSLPVAALEILRFAVGTHRLQELTHFGRTYPAAEAVGLGLIDEAVAGASVLARAVAIADQFAALAPEPLAHTRRQIRGPVLDRITQQRATGPRAVTGQRSILSHGSPLAPIHPRYRPEDRLPPGSLAPPRSAAHPRRSSALRQAATTQPAAHRYGCKHSLRSADACQPRTKSAAIRGPVPPTNRQQMIKKA